MKKRNIIIISAVLVVLVAAYVFAVNYNPASDTPTSDKPTESIVVFEKDSASLTKIEFKNDMPFTLVKNGENWAIEGKNVEILQDKALSITYNAAYISAVSKIKNAENLGDFGLDNPSSIVTVHFGDKSQQMLLGSKTPTDNYYYFKLADKDDVYTISEYTADIFFKTPSSVRDLNIVALEVTDILGFEISSPTETLKVDYSPLEEGEENPYNTLSIWDITSPFVHKAENEKVVEKLVTPASSVIAEAVVEDNPSSLSKYGLDTTVTIKTADKNIILRTGSANGVNYAYRADKKILYSVSASSVAFSKVRGFDLIQRLIALPQLTELKSVTVSTPNIEGTLTLKKESEEVTKYFYNDKYAEETAFKSLYQKIVALSIDGVIQKPITQIASYGTIEYVLNNESTVSLEFFPYDDLNVAVEKNGVIQFFMKKSKLSELEEALKKFKDNPTQKVQ